jgi:putative SOS response-associated peptidase YedK
MCGRFSLGAAADTLAAQFDLADRPEWAPRYNLAPTQDTLTVLRLSPEGRRECRRMRWGLIPSWAKDPAIGNRLINARAETVALKPAFRQAIRERRCLIVADAFYEWEAQGRRKQPWCIRRKDGAPFAFAGLWDRWHDPQGREVESCTIITTTANALIRPFHHRMPVILPPENYDPWLDVTATDPDRILALLQPVAAEEFTAYPVSPLVNNPANDSPRCIEPLPSTEASGP